MKKISIIAIALLIIANIAVIAAFSNKVSIERFLLSVYSTALGTETQEVSAAQTVGPAATIPQPTPGAVSAQFQKVFLDISDQGQSASFLESRIYKYRGKSYLLAAASAAPSVNANRVVTYNYKIYVFDISQPTSPNLLTTTNNISPGGEGLYSPNWVLLDNYQYIFAFGKIFSFDPSGSLTFVKDAVSLRCATLYINCLSADIASPLALFNEGGKVYLAAYARDYKTLYPNGDVNTAKGVYLDPTAKVKRPMYTNAILFYDVTSGLNKTLSTSGIISGFRAQVIITNDPTENLRWPYQYFGHDTFVITAGGKTYFVMEWYRQVHRLHSAAGHYAVVDVSDINNPQVVLKPDMAAEVSAIFSHDQDLTSNEKGWLNFESVYSTLIDSENNSAVHQFNTNLAALGLFAPDIENEDRITASLRLRNVIIGEKLSGGSSPFTEMPNTRTVLCEQIGANEGMNMMECGTRAVSLKSTGFGSAVAFKNGVTIGSAGKASVFSSGGFAFSDTSAQLFTPVIATIQTAYGTRSSDRLVSASLVQTGSKGFAAYVMTDKKMGVAKLTVSSALPSGGGGGGGGGDNQLFQNNSAPISPSTFNFNSLLRIFRRILNK
jgi:hypothetical protein